jgi:hypothetical protein
MTNDSLTFSVESEIDQRTLGKLIEQAKVVANEYRRLTGRPLGITGEVAEYEAIRLLGLKLAKAREAGHDATDPKTGLRIQIKGRTLYSSKKKGRVPKIDLEQEAWDVVLLVLLDQDFEPIWIYEAQRPDIEMRLRKPGSKARNERGQMDISQFISISRLIWPTDTTV